MQREVSQVLHPGYSTRALASCPGGFVWVPQGPYPGAWAAFLTGTGRK